VKHEDETKEQLMGELEELRQRNPELEKTQHERKQAEVALRRIEWLLAEGSKPGSGPEKYKPPYGNLSELNTSRLVLDSVGETTLTDGVADFLDLLETSAAVYEKNGDYALGIFSSDWCRFLDQASRKLCASDNNREALESGKWLCHESCWTDASKVSIKRGQPVDVECHGGIRIHAVPIWAGGGVVGSVNFGYGDPPREAKKLQEIAEKYNVGFDKVREVADLYESRPRFIIAVAKRRLLTSARLIGEIVERKQAENALRNARDELERRVTERTAELERANEELRIEIAERKRMEEALLDSSEKLRFFAYSVIHDLKSPTIGIYGLTELLHKHYKDALDQRGKSYCDQILKASVHVAALIEKINVYIATKESPLQIENVNVKEVLQIIKDEFSPKLTIRQIEWIEPETIPEIRADRLSILRVFRNIVDNARKYGGEDLTEVRFGYEESIDFHTFSVSDNGVGIRGGDYEKIFAPFRRGESSKALEGAGLGLAIVREVAERHGGRVWVEPRHEGGTTFYMSLSKDL